MKRGKAHYAPLHHGAGLQYLNGYYATSIRQDGSKMPNHWARSSMSDQAFCESREPAVHMAIETPDEHAPQWRIQTNIWQKLEYIRRNPCTI